MLGKMIDIDAAAIGSDPQLQASHQQVGDKGIDIGGARGGIVQVFHPVIARRDEFQSEGCAYGYLSGSQLRNGLHVVDGICKR